MKRTPVETLADTRQIYLMWIFRALFAIVIFAMLVHAAHAENDGGCSIIRPQPDGWLAVRSGPGTQHRLIRKLLPGREVHIERKNGGWHFISTG